MSKLESKNNDEFTPRQRVIIEKELCYQPKRVVPVLSTTRIGESSPNIMASLRENKLLFNVQHQITEEPLKKKIIVINPHLFTLSRIQPERDNPFTATQIEVGYLLLKRLLQQEGFSIYYINQKTGKLEPLYLGNFNDEIFAINTAHEPQIGRAEHIERYLAAKGEPLEHYRTLDHCRLENLYHNLFEHGRNFSYCLYIHTRSIDAMGEYFTLSKIEQIHVTVKKVDPKKAKRLVLSDTLKQCINLMELYFDINADANELEIDSLPNINRYQLYFFNPDYDPFLDNTKTIRIKINNKQNSVCLLKIIGFALPDHELQDVITSMPQVENVYCEFTNSPEHLNVSSCRKLECLTLKNYPKYLTVYTESLAKRIQEAFISGALKTIYDQITIHCIENGSTITIKKPCKKQTSSRYQIPVETEIKSETSNISISTPGKQPNHSHVVTFNNKMEQIDANTYSDPEEKMQCPILILEKTALDSLSKTFPPYHLRINVHTNLRSNINPSSEQDLKSMGLHRVTHFDNKLKHQLQPNDAVVQFIIKPTTDWQPLPRRHINDAILAIKIPQNSTIRYNHNKDQYEILLTDDRPVTIQYQLRKTKQFHHFRKALTEDVMLEPLTKQEFGQLEYLIKESENKETETNILSFLHAHDFISLKDGPFIKKIELLKELPNLFKQYFSNEKLQHQSLSQQEMHNWLRILQEQKGACSHRSRVFFRLCQYLNVPVREISNKVHAFVSIYNGKDWEQIDLGGHPAIIAPTPSDFLWKETPDTTSIETKVNTKKEPSTQSMPTNEVAGQTANALTTSWQSYFSPMEKLKKHHNVNAVLDALQQRNHLLNCKDASAARAIYAALAKKNRLSKTPSTLPLHYCETSIELDSLLRSVIITASGDSKTIGDPFSLLSRGGTLVIHWERFTASEMASYQDLLQTPPTWHGQPVSNKLNIINLMTPETKKSPSFSSRNMKVFNWPDNITWPEPVDILKRQLLKNADSKHKTSKLTKEEKTYHPIDLYNNRLQWHALLLGDVTITGTSALLKFVLGALSEALDKGCKGLRIIDPPLSDPNFQAMMARLQYQRSIVINNQLKVIPTDFKFQYIEAPTFMPLDKTPATQLPKINPIDTVFYLNSATLATLSKQGFSLNKKRGIVPIPAWLKQPIAKGAKRWIIQTGELNQSQIRQAIDLIKQYNTGDNASEFAWVDISSYPQAAPQAIKTIHAKSMPKQSTIITTNDPSIVAKQWKTSCDVSIAINSQSKVDALLELVTSLNETKSTASTQSASWQNALRCSSELKAVAKALLATPAQTVLLHGLLSQQLYQALETVFALQPHLNTFAEPNKRPIKGRLIIVTRPLNYATPLAHHGKQRADIADDVLWQAYQQQLRIDFGERFNQDYFKKLQQFFTMAQHLPHGGVDGPSTAHVSYVRLSQCMRALLDNTCSDNPIKPWCHHDYARDTETYAYLNVLAKLLFGHKSIAAGIRSDKLKRYQQGSSNYWRRLNCCNSAQLKRLFNGDDLSTISKLAMDQHDVTLGNTYWYRQIAQPQLKQSRNKVLKETEKHLNQSKIVVLKGPSGSGKTYTYHSYVNHKKGHKFYANSAISFKAWLEAKPINGKPLTLLMDEANSALPGVWECLRPLLESALSGETPTVTWEGVDYPLSKYHQAIATCNHENYPGRYYHHILQDAPTIDVMHSWTDQELRGLLGQLFYRLSDRFKSAKRHPTDEERTILSQFVKLYRQVQDKLPGAHISLRDLQQLVVRWMWRMQQSAASKPTDTTIARNACLDQWRYGFMLSQQHDLFKQCLDLALPLEYEPFEALKQSAITFFGSFMGYTTTDQKDQTAKTKALKLKNKSTSIAQQQNSASCCMTEQQHKLIAAITESMSLAEWTHGIRTLDDSPLAKHSISIEGPSGTGKSKVCKQVLLNKGYQPCDIKTLLSRADNASSHEVKALGNNYFIQFTARYGSNEDETLLKAAAKLNYKVIIDEINVNPSLEGLINDLSTGKTTDGQPAEASEFFVLATQNSVLGEGGRKSLSIAHKNRSELFYMQAHNHTELLNFAKEKLPDNLKSQAGVIVQAYFNMQQKHGKELVNDRRFFLGLDNIISHAALKKQQQTALLSARQAAGFFKPMLESQHLLVSIESTVQVVPPSYD